MIIKGYDVNVVIGDCYKHEYYGLGVVNSISPKVDFPIEMTFIGFPNKHFSIHGEEFNNERNENLIRFPIKKIEKEKSPAETMPISTIKEVENDIASIISEFEKTTGVLITNIAIEWLCNTDHRKNLTSANVSNIEIRSKN